MSKQNIIISCDTTIALSKEEILKEGLNVIPLNAIADGIEYHDTVDIDAAKLCDLMRKGAKISTSTPTIGEIESFFDNLFEKTNADIIIHFTISSKLSSMFSLFTTVCSEKYGERVIVVDSLSICTWMHQQVKYATYLASLGLSADEIISKVKNELVDTEDCVFVPETLEYLKRGGRISPAVATIANFLGVLPILTFNHGEVGKKGTTRTMQKAFLNAYNEWKVNIKDFKENYQLVLLNTDPINHERLIKAQAILNDFIDGMEIVNKNLSLNVTAHTGPGAIGLGIIKKVKM